MTRFALLALAAASIASPALAQSAVKVNYADLDLQTRSGAHEMMARVTAAADRVCGFAPILADLNRRAAYDACMDATVAKAVSALHAPLVTAASRTATIETILAASGGPR